MSSSTNSTSLFGRSWDRFQVMIGQLLQDQAGISKHATNTIPVQELLGPQRQSSKESEKVNWLSLGLEVTVRLLVVIGSGYLVMYMSRKALEGLNNSGDEAETEKTTHRRLRKILSKRDQSASTTKKASVLPPLSQYERIMAQEVVHPDDIVTSFADVGGLDNIKREIYQLAILPLIQPHLFQSKLVEPTKGILLYGKPGVGKTMLAKALAKEAHAVFLPLQLSKILSKWVGESNKLVAATFSLAHKLQPCILFVDELDTFLKANHDSTAYLDSIKAEFLTLWDGISTNERSRVLVLGATNQPQNIDAAILRRMPRTFMIPLPDCNGRLDILQRLVAGEELTNAAREFLPELARLTPNYSGSDLKELCKAAAMVRIHEYTADFSAAIVSGRNGGEIESNSRPALRPISMDDWVVALQKVQRTGAAAQSYGLEEQKERQTGDIRALAKLLHSLSALSNTDADDNIPNINV